MKFEEHGIDAIPKVERTKSWRDLFIIQGGIAFSFPTLLIGGLLAPGLGWAQAVWANVAGNIILACLVALVGYYGVDYGIPTAVASRFFLGEPIGTRLCSVLLLMSLVGWYAVITELAGQALSGIVRNATGFSSPSSFIILVGILNCIPAVLGFENIKILNRAAIPALVFLAAWMLYAVFRTHPFHRLVSYQATHEFTFGTGLDWIVGGFIVGTFIASDYSRYVKSRSDNWIGSFSGVVPPAVFLGLTGVLAKVATSDPSPVTSVEILGLGIPGMLLTILSTVPSSESCLYSAGLALTNVLPRYARWKNTLAMMALGTALAVFGITRYMGDFLSSLSFVFAPLVGVSICDYFIVRRGRLDLHEAYQTHQSQNSGWLRGVNVAAVLAIAAGIAVGAATVQKFPSSISSFLFSSIVYSVLAMRSRFSCDDGSCMR